MTTFFISDLHLAPERPEVSRAFFHFLSNEARGAGALYILGDLFEAWIGDDDPSELSQLVVTALADLHASGTQLYFQHGNRDFMVGKRFARDTGAVLLPDRHVVDLYGEPVLLLHGDTLCTDDLDYQRFRRRVRNRFAIWLLGRLPLKKRLEIATRWRAGSKEANSNKPEYIMDVNQQAVEQQLRKFGVKRMIHGHTHRPQRHQIELDGEACERIVLGDWHDNAWLLRARPGELALEHFPIS